MKKKRRTRRGVNDQKGGVLLMVVMLFLFISLSVIFGFGASAMKDFQNTRDSIKSKQSYFVAESGLEDAVYRISSGKNIPSVVEMGLNGATTTTEITDIGGGEKEAISTGSDDENIRKIKVRFRESTIGASFNYGIQVGSGGLTMSNNSGVYGNVYANGDITGSNGSFITGTAIAANSTASVADQINDTPATPANSIIFGNANGTQDFAQSFQVSSTSAINKVDIYMKKVGLPSNITVRITTSSASGIPETTITSGTISASSVTTGFSWISAVFSPTPDLVPGTTYWIVLDASTGTAGKNYIIGANTAYTAGSGKIGQLGGVWNATNPSGLDGYFKVYLGGLTGTIDGVIIGTNGVGNAKAHTVTDSTIAGTLYCQVGTGNNKVCNTSQPDPTPQPFAISEGNIEQWKSEALAGGTFSGNYNLSGSSATLGPKYITGDLTLSDSAILTLSGTIWVGGKITMSNGTKVKLVPSYESNSGVLLSDDRVSISNNSTFSGSGAVGSYILLLTTSQCPNNTGCAGAYALSVQNNVGAVLLDAHNGTLHLGNNAGAKEATGSRIILDNNATITYDSGLVNANFSSGPSGGFSVLSWREIE